MIWRPCAEMRIHKCMPASFSQDVISSCVVDCCVIGFEPLMNAGGLMLRLGCNGELCLPMRWAEHVPFMHFPKPACVSHSSEHVAFSVRRTVSKCSPQPLRGL